MKKMKTVNTLQNLSRDKIVLEFGSYYQQYCATEDSCLKLKFEFLRKKFSSHITERLKEEHQLKTEYLNFLINKYLKMLDTWWLEDWPWKNVLQKLAEIGPYIQKVNFDGDRPWDKILFYLPNLKCVYFYGYCSDEFLIYLCKFCSCIEILEIGDSDVSEKGVEYVLKNMHNLQQIDCIKHLPDILYAMHKIDINAFEKVKPYNLTHLVWLLWHNYNADETNDILTICVFLLPHLKSLTCPIFQKRHLDLCSQLQELEDLELFYLEEPYLELNEFLTLNGKNLTSLKICKFCISLSVLAQNCPHLNLLRMEKVNLQHNINDSVPVFHNLQEIIFDNFNFIEPVSQAVKCLLASVPNLNRLIFINCKVVSSDIKTQILRCCEQCQLSVIEFNYSEVELVLLRDILVTCSTLKTLYLCGCDITGNYEAMYELKRIAVSLRNKPQVLP